MKKPFLKSLLVFSLLVPQAIAVQWPQESHPFGVPGTDENLQEYATHVVKEYPLVYTAEDQIPTLNRMGTTLKKAGPFPLKFLDFTYQSGLPSMSVGEGTGNIARLALERNITFIANDMDPRHLGHLYASMPKDKLKYLFLKAGKFPDEVHLPEKSLGAIYYGRVFHFFTGEEIERALENIA